MEILLPAERIQQRVDELARQIAADFHGRPTTIVGVLTGCLMFLSDLVRRIDLPLRIGLVQASSYRGAAVTPGALRIGPELMPDVRDRHVLLLDDILDTGQTLAYLIDHLQGTRRRVGAVGGAAAQDRPPARADRAGLLRLRHPRRFRGRLRTRLQRRVPSFAVYRNSP